MELIVNFAVLIIFALWLQYKMRKAARLSEKSSKQFWEKERQANLSRKADISGLDYITIPVESLPVSDTDDATVNSYRDTVLSLSGKKIVDLTGFTNTELKLKYGPANLPLLSEYDNNYIILVSILQKWGARLLDKGYIAEAAAVLEFAVKCKTDVKNTYRLLARIYKEQHAPDKIDALIDAIPQTKITDKPALIHELSSIRDS